MHVERCTRDDFFQILEHQTSFWDSDRALSLHHPMLLEEFGRTAFVVRDGGVPCGYLFGFFIPDRPGFYIHLVAVRDTHRGKGIASALYNHAEGIAAEAGCEYVKAITTIHNSGSVAFHEKLGFETAGSADHDGVRHEPDYAGKGRDRVILIKRLNPEGCQGPD